MKATLTILILLFFVVKTKQTKPEVNNNIALEVKATFDAQEGNMLFFTDENEKALTIKDDKLSLFKKFKKSPNTYVDEEFKIIVKNKEIKHNSYTSKDVEKLILLRN